MTDRSEFLGLDDAAEMESTGVGGHSAQPFRPGVGDGTESTSTIVYAPERAVRSRDIRRYVSPSQRDLDRMREAMRVFTSADHELVERSNAFDEWRALAYSAAEHSSAETPYFRQVLGMLLAATHGLDFVDLSEAQVSVLLQVVNLLHAPSVVERDVARASRLLTRTLPVRLVARIDDDEADEEDTYAEFARAWLNPT